MGFKVTAPLVAIAPGVKSGDLDDANDGPRYFYQGAVIQDGFNDERCEELVEEGMLEKVEAAKADADPDGPPAKSASKGDWVAFATAEERGDYRLSEEDANAATKDELIALYGDN